MRRGTTIRRACVLAILAALPASVQAEEPNVVVRTQVDPKDGVVIGQPVRLLVDVLFPDSMPRPPRVAVGDTPGAQILRFEAQGVTTGERIDDRAYVGQRFEFVVLPRRGGVIDLPAPEVTLLDASADITGHARGTAQHIAVTVPPGIDASQPSVAATSFTMTQSWDPEPTRTRFKPGDAVVRTIRRQAPSLPAMGMADLAFTAPDGVRLYVDGPQSDDRTNRGEVVGTRTDKVTYVFEKPGFYDLPALTQHWWKLDDREPRTETLPGARVGVTAGAVSVAPRDPSWLSSRVGAGLVAVGLLAIFLFVVRETVSVRWRRFLKPDTTTESWARDDLCRIAPSGNARDTYRALTVWLQRLPVGTRERVAHDERMAPLIGGLQRSLFGHNGSWSIAQGQELRAAVTVVARKLKNDTKSLYSNNLPPLNPVARKNIRAS